MADVVLLEFAGPPPGYIQDERRAGYLRDIHNDLVGPLADAWKHYKERFDPPGMKLGSVGGALRFWYITAPGAVGYVSPQGDLKPEAESRAAAWRWYEARVELYNILRKLNPPREFWPLILTWSDQEWLEVHSFLVEHFDVILTGGADGLTFPAVLRG